MTRRQQSRSFLLILLTSALTACGFSDGKFAPDLSAR